MSESLWFLVRCFSYYMAVLILAVYVLHLSALWAFWSGWVAHILWLGLERVTRL